MDVNNKPDVLGNVLGADEDDGCELCGKPFYAVESGLEGICGDCEKELDEEFFEEQGDE